MSAGSSVTAQFRDFQKMVKKSEQDLIPVLDMEEKGIQGRWKGRQLQDSIQVFADLVKKHYGKYPIIYSNESFYNKEMGANFDWKRPINFSVGGIYDDENIFPLL
jgi:lysozyme